MSGIFEQLKAEFPRNAVSWRAQSMKQDGTAALALAYIDARDVMNRLDEVLGPDGWQDRYEFHGSRTICYLSITTNGGIDWITKADGAGDTDVEAEKGGISDAFKRAAVKWGIGRYLYDLDAPWVDCESYERGGKRYWKRWTQDPWSKVKNSSSAPQQGRSAAGANPPRATHPQAPAATLTADQQIAKIATFTLASDMFQWANSGPVDSAYRALTPEEQERVSAAFNKRQAEIESPFQEAAE